MAARGTILAAVLVLVGSLLLTAALAIGPAAQRSVPEPGQPETPAIDPGSKPAPVVGDPRPPRGLPLKYDDYVLATHFPGETPFTGARVDPARGELLARLGMAAAWPEIDAASARQREAIVTQSEDKRLAARPPFPYPWVDPVLRRHLTPDAIRREPKAVIELSTLLIAHAVESDGDTKQYGPVAQSLLQYAAEVTESCDVQLSLAFSYSLAMEPDDDAVRDSFREAAALCGDDPTPEFELGMFQLSRASVSATGLTDPLPYRSDVMRQLPIDTFRAMQARHADSPWGYAGEAYAYYRFAELAADDRVMTYSVRTWFEQSLELFERAWLLGGDPIMAAGRARVLHRLGDSDAAVAVLEPIQAADPDDPNLQVDLLSALRGARRYSDAASRDKAMPDPAPRTGFVLRRAGDVGTDSEVRAGLTLGGGEGARRGVNMFDLTSPSGRGGGDIVDRDFVPDYRWHWAADWDRPASHALDLILAGRADEAQVHLEKDNYLRFKPELSHSIGFYPSEAPDPTLVALAAIEAGDTQGLDQLVNRLAPDHFWSDLYEKRQDLWRYGGNLEQAEAVTKEWIRLRPWDAYAWDRLGEVHYLTGDYQRAELAFRAAEPLFPVTRSLDPNGPVSVELGKWALLKRGAAHEAAGETGAAQRAYGSVWRWYSSGAADPGFWADKLGFYAASQRGTLCLRTERFECAETALENAVEIGRTQVFMVPFDGGEEALPNTFMRGAQENNLALAKARLHRGPESIQAATDAVAHDPRNPIFADSQAYALTDAGRDGEALEKYAESLRQDPTNFVARNNVAVLTARAGDSDEARRMIEATIAENPGYAAAWFNLGVLLGEEPARFLQSQGALGRAAALDGGFRGVEAELQIDHAIYSTALDVSRPVRPDWSFAASSSRSPIGLTWWLLLVLIVRVGWALGLDKIVAGFSSWLINTTGRSDFWRMTVGRRLPAWVAVLATSVAVGAGMLWGGRLVTEALLGVVAMTGLMVTIMGVRQLAGARDRQFSWGPAVLLTGLAIPLGNPVVSAPCLDDQNGRRKLGRAVALWVMALVIAGFLATGVLTGTPVTRLIAILFVAVLGTSLMPVAPMDGAYLAQGRRVANAAIAAALAFGTVAFALNWL